jgi:hypothetical protein
VEIDTIAIEESGEDQEEEVNVDWQHGWENHKGKGTNKLVNKFISNHSEGSWVVEDVVMLVDIPHDGVAMAKPSEERDE